MWKDIALYAAGGAAFLAIGMPAWTLIIPASCIISAALRGMYAHRKAA